MFTPVLGLSTSRKWKILPKTKIFPKPTSSGLSSSISATFYKVCILGPTLGIIYPLKEAEIEKSKYFFWKTIHQNYSNIQKWRPYLVSIFNEKYNYFLWYFVFWHKWAQKSKIKRLEVRLAPLFRKPLYMGLWWKYFGLGSI